MEKIELSKTLDKILSNNKDAGDPGYKVFYKGSCYWYIIKEEFGHAINPFDKEKDMYAGIAYEIYEDEIGIWGLAIDPQTKDITWMELHQNPTTLILQHYNNERETFDFQEDEEIGYLLADESVFGKIPKKYLEKADLVESIYFNLVKPQIYFITEINK